MERRSLKTHAVLTLAVTLLCLAGGHVLFAAPSITVLLLNAKTGKPLARTGVLLTVTQSGKVTFQSYSITNSSGVAVVNLPESIPERINLSYGTVDLGTCSDVGFPTAEILNEGLVSKNKCYGGKLPHDLNSRPGEIVVFGSPVGLWERILREIP